ncbi:extracellular ribonuclease LE-like protein [Cinnamomum micranthum f. kanehirae]|uniref:Extracellular ribonuclease LE-like protein n=1 Tax=Cinnamomum micranthum f. kanehirae TaxID=337451 RepID=A0A3S4NI10_9MAGN|nr:extracellular ribonuclease LE-like protein [Cinnamomum micranthum f. kanehirae]
MIKLNYKKKNLSLRPQSNSNDFKFYPFVYKYLNRLPIGAFRSAAMARHIGLAFLLSLLFCAQNIAYADFDFYYLVLEWPGSYCKDCTVNGCCKPTTFTNYPLEEDFLIKGLYTYSDSGQAVTKCNTTKFYVNALRNLIGDLYVHWPSIKCPSNNGVSQWRDAWTNYGVCSGLSEEDYFDKALKLRKKINMLSVLKWKGIFPSDFLFYSPLYVETAIKFGLGADVGIKCNTNKWGTISD